jgi:hypothetical protein
MRDKVMDGLLACPSCSDSHGVCQDETNLRKALSDLDTEAPQDAKE